MRWLVMLFTISLFACGSDSGGPSTAATLNVRFDSQTCSSGNAEIFVDGTSRGAFSWTPGQGRNFDIVAGQHAVGATEIGGTLFTWPAQSFSVVAGQTFNAIFTC